MTVKDGECCGGTMSEKIMQRKAALKGGDEQRKVMGIKPESKT